MLTVSALFFSTLFHCFTYFFQEYIPFVFQILAQMLQLHKGDVPAEYRSLLSFLLSPAIWQQKGSIPGLVKLLRVFLARDVIQLVSTGQFTSILAIVQQRLIPSKLHDAWGFELLQGVVEYTPPSVIIAILLSM